MGKNNPRLRKSVPVGRQVDAVPVRKSVGDNVVAAHLSDQPSDSEAIESMAAFEDDHAEPAPEDAADPAVPDEALLRQQEARRQRIEKADQAERKKKRRRRIRCAILAIVILLVLVFAGLLIAFSVFRWHTYDDASDIQGTWYHEGTTVPVTITEDEIRLTDEVSYRYELDPEAKTITFKFGNMEGGGRYRFSLDRSELAIVDGQFDGSENFINDALWMAKTLFDKIFFAQEDSVSEEGEGVSVFSRNP